MDSIQELIFRPLASRSSAKASELECEVMSLFDRFRNPLFRYVVSIGLPVQGAEEILEEVFHALIRHLSLRGSRRDLQVWIFRVAHRFALKQRSARDRLRHTMTSGSAVADVPSDSSANPKEQAAILRALPEQDRCCAYLRAEGLRYREIAQVLDISLQAVSVSLARSLAELNRLEGS